MAELSRKLGEMSYDGLITDLVPPVIVRAGTIAKGDTEAELVRGTIMAKSASTGKLSVLGTTAGSGDTLTPDCILIDNVTVGTAADATVPMYVAGCFDLAKCTVAEGYTVTEADKDKLRERGILFKGAASAL